MYKTIIHTATLDNQAIEKLNAVVKGELEATGQCHVLHHKASVSRTSLSDLSQALKIDINLLPDGFDPLEISLLMTDMDSTLINIECVDEIADFAGVKPEVHAITEAAMRGELDFAQSLTRRVGLLKGLNQSVLQEVYDNRLKLNPGADQMLACLKSRRVKTALVSGGFTFFTDRLQSRLQLDYSRANVLEIQQGCLMGKVEGDIVGAEAKRDFLLSLCDELGINTSSTIAMGDGANDLIMMEKAGLSIAYHAKPKVQQEADIALNYSGLNAVCDLLTP